MINYVLACIRACVQYSQARLKLQCVELGTENFPCDVILQSTEFIFFSFTKPLFLKLLLWYGLV